MLTLEEGLDALSDTDLMTQLRRGNTEAALSQLFHRHHGPLYGFLFRMTRCQATSEDLVQEAFLRVLRFEKSFKAGSDFKPWLYRIARNLLADHFRHAQPVAEAFETPLPSLEPCPHTQLESKQDHERLTWALAQLPIEKRELLLLAKEGELDYARLSEVFGCRAGTLKVRVHRALHDLRTVFFTKREAKS